MSSQAFSAADRALRVKRRAFSGEIFAVLNEAESEAGLKEETFVKKKGLF